jgi:hypothetical protein
MAEPIKRFKVGVIGMSEGNGHPYSWSAIINGYNEEYMKDCPFLVIPQYLSKQKFPQDSLGHLGRVTNIWTQNRKISEHIALSSKITKIDGNLSEMVEDIDAVLLARDDAENHFEMALPFLAAGIPIFIDKPLALSVEAAKCLLDNQLYEHQIFSCSSFRFESELFLTKAEHNEVGKVEFVEAQIPKSWEKYAIHLLEPIVAAHPNRGKLLSFKKDKWNELNKAQIFWENLTASISTYGKYQVPINITYFGEKGYISKPFKDTFSCFKKTLQTFFEGIRNQKLMIPRNETLEIIEIIEKGMNHA